MFDRNLVLSKEISKNLTLNFLLVNDVHSMSILHVLTQCLFFQFRMMNSFSKENETRDTNQVLETSSGSLFDRIMKGLNTDEVGFGSASQDESKYDSDEELEKKLEELALATVSFYCHAWLRED